MIPDKKKLNHQMFNQTHDEWYYKMYFSMLKAMLVPTDTYNIFIDIKDTHSAERAKKLWSVAKRRIIELIQKRSGYTLQKSTLLREDKLNLFVWKSRND
ncbi:MAG: hypothetical protein UIH18_08670 [Fibrobacteraceae bacterium]|nr:hypothetical protein [Fibrobacteraceae bacterium]